MGRRNAFNGIPQRQRGEADREVRRALGAPLPKAIGIRRPLEHTLSYRIVGAMHELQSDGDIPDHVDLRQSLHVTLLPQKAFGRQVLKGLATGYNLGRLSAQLERNDVSEPNSFALAEMEDVRVYKGRVICVKLESEELEKERSHIAQIMGSMGLKGMERNQGILHMTIGQTKNGLTVTEQRHIQHTVHETIDSIHHQEEPLSFGPWQTYPDISYWQQ